MTSTAVAKSTQWLAVAGGVTEGERDIGLAEANVGAPRNVHQRQTLISVQRSQRGLAALAAAGDERPGDLAVAAELVEEQHQLVGPPPVLFVGHFTVRRACNRGGRDCKRAVTGIELFADVEHARRERKSRACQARNFATLRFAERAFKVFLSAPHAHRRRPIREPSEPGDAVFDAAHLGVIERVVSSPAKRR